MPLVLAAALLLAAPPARGTGRPSLVEPALDELHFAAPPAGAEYDPPVLHPRVREVPGRIIRGLSVDPDRWIGPLVTSLVADIDDESTRVKVLHDWVTQYIGYDTTLLGSTAPGGTSRVEALRSGRSGCAGYSTVFETLCEHADIKCVTVTGYARGYGFDFLGPEDPTRSNHAWNAVLVDGDWRFVDATWDAGHIRDGVYRDRYATDFLLVHPGQLIHTHFPDEDSWQLLETPITADQFSRLPVLTGEFFRYGIRLVEPLARVSRVRRTARVKLWASEDLSLYARLIRPDGHRLQSGISQTRNLERVVFDIELPGPGRWGVGVFARPGPPEGEHVCVALFEFVREGDAPGPED